LTSFGVLLSVQVVCNQLFHPPEIVTAPLLVLMIASLYIGLYFPSHRAIPWLEAHRLIPLTPEPEAKVGEEPPPPLPHIKGLSASQFYLVVLLTVVVVVCLSQR
jgi:hypothetical protein